MNARRASTCPLGQTAWAPFQGDWVAQTFTAGRSGNLTDVVLPIVGGGAPAQYTLSITPLDSAGAPAVATPLASATGSLPAATPPFGVLPDVDVAFPTPAAVVAGTTYAIVVTSTSGRVAWQADLGPSQSVGCQSGAYAGGRVFFSSGPRDDSDAFFQEYIVPNLTVSLAVHGPGTVSLNPAGTACATASCTATVLAGTSLTLTARPASGYRFAGWSGGCTGTNPTCSIDVEDNVSVTAGFTVLTLPLTVRVIGKGMVSGSGVSCGGSGRRCKAVLRWGQIARLTARGVAGGRFDHWAGACHGRNPVCSVKISRATSVIAVNK